jgi:hypothetical protein
MRKMGQEVTGLADFSRLVYQPFSLLKSPGGGGDISAVHEVLIVPLYNYCAILLQGVTHDREGYALAAGIALGLICLAKGRRATGLADLDIEVRLG